MNITRGLLAGVAALCVAACGDNKSFTRPDAAPDAEVQDPAERGAYIVNVLGACTFCHTPLLASGERDPNKLLAGVDCFVDLDSPTFLDDGGPTGCLSTRNLTPHATGLGNRTDTEIKNAFRNGIRTDGKKIVPVMPWWLFHNMTDDDADAVVAYLRSIPPVDHTVKANQEPFKSFNDGIALPGIFAVWAAMTPLLDAQIPLPRGGANNESAMRGRYLTTSVGLCIDCHTPEIFPFALQLDLSRPFGGGKVFPKEQLGLVDTAGTAYPPAIATRNLTPHMTGLAGWTKAQIKAAISEGRDRDNKAVCAGTHGKLTSPYAALTPQDLDDIAEYLSLLPAIDNDTITNPAIANCGPPAIPFVAGDGPETGADCDNAADDDTDGTADDGCGEEGAECLNMVDDDGDTVPNDGCLYPCGDCQGPAVP